MDWKEYKVLLEQDLKVQTEAFKKEKKTFRYLDNQLKQFDPSIKEENSKILGDIYENAFHNARNGNDYGPL